MFKMCWLQRGHCAVAVAGLGVLSFACAPSTAADSEILICGDAEDPIAYCEEKHEPAGGEVKQWACTNNHCPDFDFVRSGCYPFADLEAAEIRPDGPCMVKLGPVVDGTSTESDADSSTDTLMSSSDDSSESSDTSTATGSSSNTSSTTGSSSDTTSSTTTMPNSCKSDLDCDQPELPYCDTARKTCVACLRDEHCPSTQPICGEGAQAGTCVGCSELWGQCPDSAACLTIPGLAQSGQCMTQLRYVAKSGSCSDSGPGSQAQPFCTMARAMTDIHEPTTIHVPGGGRFAESITVASDTQVAFASSGGTLILAGNGTDANLTLSTASAAILDHVEVSESSQRGVVLNGSAKLLALASRFRGNGSDGIAAMDGNGEFYGIDCSIAENVAYGINFGGRGLYLTNSMVGANGRSDAEASGGIWLGPEADLVGVYTSIVGNQSQAPGSQLRCGTGTRVSLINSLFFGPSDTSVSGCNRVELDHSAHSLAALQSSGAANKLLTDGVETTNTWFVDLITGDLRLKSPAAEAGVEWLRDVAQRRADDPDHDFEGNARPSVGQPDWPGADRAQP